MQSFRYYASKSRYENEVMFTVRVNMLIFVPFQGRVLLNLSTTNQWTYIFILSCFIMRNIKYNVLSVNINKFNRLAKIIYGDLCLREMKFKFNNNYIILVVVNFNKIYILGGVPIVKYC